MWQAPTPCSPISSSSQPLVETTSASSRARQEELKDVLDALNRQELNYYKTLPDSEDPWRPVMLAWMYSVVDIFELVPHVVSTAMYYLDHSFSLIQSPSDYQLLGLTTLQLAIKVHETKLFPLEDLVQIGQSGFCCDEVIDMERRLLRTLQFKLHPTTPENWLHQFAELLPCKDMIVPYALQLIRQGLLQSVPVKPSILAYASLLHAIERIRLEISEKQTFCLQMLQVSGLSATTPGLAQAYRALRPQPMAAVQSVQPMQSPEAATPYEQGPLVSQPTQSVERVFEPEWETDEHECEPDAQEIIFCVDDGIEVSWSKSLDDDEIDLATGTLSPRNVVY